MAVNVYIRYALFISSQCSAIFLVISAGGVLCFGLLSHLLCSLLRTMKRSRGQFHSVRSQKPTVYDKYGYSVEVERVGSHDMPNVCYLGASSFCHKDLGYVLGVAFIRKVMKKHYGYEYAKPGEIIARNIPTVTAPLASTGPLSISFLSESMYPAAGAGNGLPTVTVRDSYVFYDPATGSVKTLAEFANWFWQTICIDPNDYYNTPTSRLYGYRFTEADYTVFQPDPNGGAIARQGPLHCVKDLYVKCYSAVDLVIQNRTKADVNDGAQMMSTRIDRNPVEGKAFRFSSRVPMPRTFQGVTGSLYGGPGDDYSWQLMQENGDPVAGGIDSDGVIIPPGAPVGAGADYGGLLGDWKQVPTAKMFTNCVAERKVALNPGQLNTVNLMFKFNGKLLRLMEGAFRKQGNAGSTFYTTAPLQSNMFGTAVLYALEKKLPEILADETVPVHLSFKYNARIGCVFGKTANILMTRGAIESAAA